MSESRRENGCPPGPESLNKYIQTWTCRDGRHVTLRPIKPDDRLLEKIFIEGLSGESSRYRFFDMVKEASPQMLDQFCDIDYESAIAIMAEYGQDNTRRNVGVVRLVLDLDRQNGEFAIVVADDFQNNGLGEKLMTVLIDIARERRLKSIYGMVLSDNYKMLSLAKKFGFVIGRSTYEGTKIVRQL